ncbi:MULTISPECIES: SH3 domain-containing protein [Chryseobacterium]|uniref:SH3 domain-containing protein n=1 Tax=Chryseobacterium bernardetii TaxID=1241978 RepID=A0A3G6T6X2_9FLAO|nr:MULTISPECIES: SH3 domain-containing protein [Chryseobacterium]AZB25061.1 SH3 domain-containing protein [Chryseobacterium bernardetii]AZB35612.1 SH3 domain-containing protein [Chryseobacterium bernardetii]UCA59517.1 SH3 domain-containing protein [Chryseobacterium rhizoplanae]
MKTLWTALLLLTVQLFTAQENEVYADGVFNFTENKNQKIFTDWTRVRKEPGVNAQILDSLQSNQQIMILKKEESVPVLQLGERRANWYKISYQKGETMGEGYIWGGNLCVGYRNKNGYDFLFGLSKTVDRKNNSLNEIVKQNIAGIKVMEGNTLIEEIYFDTGKGEELSTASFTIESNHKLQDIEFTLKAMVSGEACGIGTYDQYVLYKDKKLIALPQLMNVGDAGVYYHSEQYVFPNDKGGIPNAFILKVEDMETDDKDREKKTHSSKTYLWNGSSYKLK